MSGKKYLAMSLALAAPRRIRPDLATRFMLSQMLGTFGNGMAKASRARLQTLRGIKPSGHSHPDREIFVVADVAPQLFPGNLEAQQRLIDMSTDDYAHGKDREILLHAESLATPTLRPLPA